MKGREKAGQGGRGREDRIATAPPGPRNDQVKPKLPPKHPVRRPTPNRRGR